MAMSLPPRFFLLIGICFLLVFSANYYQYSKAEQGDREGTSDGIEPAKDIKTPIPAIQPVRSQAPPAKNELVEQIIGNVAEKKDVETKQKIDFAPNNNANGNDFDTRHSLLKKIEDAAPGPKRLELVQQFNREMPPLNVNRFTLEEGFIPIVQLVATRDMYLIPNLEFYKMSKDIEKTIMVISHDGYDANIWKVVESIDFCQVKQVLFEHNAYTLGEANWKSTGSKKGAANLKMHFTWAVNAAFSHFPAAPAVLYMEDDFWVTPDVYMSAKRLTELRRTMCPDDCFAGIVGDHPPDWHKYKYNRASWASDATLKTAHQTKIVCPVNSPAGLTIPREMWRVVAKEREMYCFPDNPAYDDALHYMMNSLTLPPSLLAYKLPRTIHVGRCGGINFNLEKTGGSCDMADELATYNKIWIDPWRTNKLSYDVPPTPLTGESKKEKIATCVDRYRDTSPYVYNQPRPGMAKVHSKMPDTFRHSCQEMFDEFREVEGMN